MQLQTPQSACFELSNISKTFDLHDENQPAAITIEQMRIPLGGIIAIVGGSGSGKTTLLNILGGLERPDSIDDGNASLTLRLPGESATRNLLSGPSLFQTGKSDVEFPYQKVSYIFQQGYLLSQASIRINLAMTRRAAALRADAVSLGQLLEMAKLHDRDEPPASRKKLSDRAITLSGGQQQRINIARAIGRDPLILFADELTSSLDPSRASAVLAELRSWIWSSGASGNRHRSHLMRSMIWVTHDYPLACQYADAVVVLSRGKLADGCNAPIELGELGAPLNAERLESWVVSGEVPKHTAEVRHQEAQPQDVVANTDGSLADTLCGANNLARKGELSGFQIALGNMATGISLSWMEAFRESPKTGDRLPGLLRKSLQPLLGFSPWVRAMQLSAVLALLMIISFGQREVIGYFDQQLDDPTLRHVIVQQNTREMQRSIIDDNSLAEISRSLAQSSDEQVVAFGRFTESVDAYPNGTDSINSGFIAEIAIGILHRDEPVYKNLRVSVIDPNAPSCSANSIGDPARLIPYADELALIVSRKYLEDAQRMFNIDLCRQPYLDLWDAGAPRRFRIVGFVDTLPADGYDHFDALMQTDVWRNWISLVGKNAMSTFSRAAVYFTQTNHSEVMHELNERSFAFDTEIVSKFERLIETAAQLRNTFLVITWLSLAVAIMVAAGLIWTYLAQNAKSIAVLRAHDAWFWPLFAAIPFQLLLTFLYALVYLGIGVVLWNLMVKMSLIQSMVELISSGVWHPEVLGLKDFVPMLPLLASSLCVMVVVGWLCLFIWRLTHRQLAHELRQAY